MSSYKKRFNRKISSKLNQKDFELPLNNGLKRVLIQRDSKLISVFYVTENKQYLKDISDVCDWIEIEKKEIVLNRRNFNFLIKKITSHESEYIMDFDMLPSDIQTHLNQKKRYIAPTILTFGSDDLLSNKTESISETESDIPNKKMKSNKISNESKELDNLAIEYCQSQEQVDNNIKQVENLISNDFLNPKIDVSIKCDEALTKTDKYNCTDIKSNNNLPGFDINLEPLFITTISNDFKIKSNDIPIKFKDFSKIYNKIEEQSNDLTINSIQTIDFEMKCNFIDKLHKNHDTIQSNSDNLSNISHKYSDIPMDSNDKISDKSIKDDSTIIDYNNLLNSLNHKEIELNNVESESSGTQNELNGVSAISETVLLKSNDLSIKLDEAPMESICLPIELNDLTIESSSDSMTLSVETTYLDNDNDNNCVKIRPRDPFEYPLAIVNMNSLVEIGKNCHVVRIQEVLNGDIDDKVMKSMKSYCGNHCSFDRNSCPRVAFECDICLILWHVDCIGHRWVDIGSINLIICDNCHLLQKTISVDIPTTFCDVDKLLHSEFKPELSSNAGTISIPTKLESMFKLCKVQWTLQNKSMPHKISIDVKTSKKITKDDVKEFPKDSKNVFKYFIAKESIMRITNDDYIKIKYNKSDVENMSSIFADSTCRMTFNEHTYEVLILKLTVKSGELVVPVASKITMSGYALFHTFYNGQENDQAYLSRLQSLKSQMLFMITKQGAAFNMESQYNIVRKLSTKQKKKYIAGNNMTQLNIPITNKIRVIPANHLLMSPTNNVKIPSFLSKDLPKNVIPISRNQVQNFTNIIKIRKRKQDFSPKVIPFMSTNHARIQYHTLVNLPFHILELILTSKNLSTIDKLNCRLANRVLKSVVDAGRVWTKVVINPGLITGLQTMFDFFSKRNVKKMTFLIDFQESFGIEFFTSFIGRLKLYPESFILNNMSIKLSGFDEFTAKFKLSIQEILSCVKSLNRLSVSSDEFISLNPGKSPYLMSESLEKLTLKKIENVSEILQTNEQYTPKLRHVHCGDWSLITEMDTLTLKHLTSLKMDFSDCVNLTDVTLFSQLTNLECLSIARPKPNEVLLKFLGSILQHKALSYFRLETEIVTKEQLFICKYFGKYFYLHIRKICWKIYMSSLLLELDNDFKRKLMNFMPVNVKLIILAI